MHGKGAVPPFKDYKREDCPMALTWHLTLRDGDEIYKEGDCLSTDTKPTTDTTLKNGSRLIEIDTSSEYRYDKENTQWLLWTEVTPQEIATAVDSWLENHPEATTTVEDGAITDTKLNSSLKAGLKLKVNGTTLNFGGSV